MTFTITFTSVPSCVTPSLWRMIQFKRKKTTKNQTYTKFSVPLNDVLHEAFPYIIRANSVYTHLKLWKQNRSENIKETRERNKWKIMWGMSTNKYNDKRYISPLFHIFITSHIQTYENFLCKIKKTMCIHISHHSRAI